MTVEDSSRKASTQNRNATTMTVSSIFKADAKLAACRPSSEFESLSLGQPVRQL